MSPDIDALSTAPEHAEKRQRRGDGQPNAPTTRSGVAPPHQTEAAENTDGTKDRRGGADRVVWRTVEKSVGKVAARAGKQDESAAESRARHAGDGAEEQCGGDGVAQHMGGIGVQRKSGHGTPELALDDELRVRAAAIEPR